MGPQSEGPCCELWEMKLPNIISAVPKTLGQPSERLQRAQGRAVGAGCGGPQGP